MATDRDHIDVQDCKLTFRINYEEVTFNIYKALKHPNEVSHDQYVTCKIVSSFFPRSKCSLNVYSSSKIGKINGMIRIFLIFDFKLESEKIQDLHRKHVSNFDNTPSDGMSLKSISKMEYEKLMNKHVKKAIVSSVRSYKDDSLMFLDYVLKCDVELVEMEELYDMLTGKVNVNAYICECQCGRKLKFKVDRNME